MTRVFVGNLSYDADEHDLRGLFSAAGALEGIEIVRDRQTGNSRGFGFVSFMMSSDAERAVEDLNGQDLKGRPLRLELARAREPLRERHDRRVHETATATRRRW